MEAPVILFVVGSGTQWEDALRIAACIDDSTCRVLDLQTLDVAPPPAPGTPYEGTHWPKQGLRTIASLLVMLRRMLADVAVVVLGQDAGRLQRIVVQTARRRGARIVVVPDGAMFDGAPPVLPPRERREEAVMGRLGIIAGRPLEFGSTSPDVWCAWGAGWVPMLQRFSPRGKVVVTGSPRAADLAGLPPRSGGAQRVLLCSQPTWVHPFPPSTTAGPTWYRWLEQVVQSAPEGAVTVRFHPRERDIIGELGLGSALREAARAPRSSLAADLASHDAVVAPFSTVLLEAAGAGRRVLSVVPEPACKRTRFGCPAFVDPRLSVRLTSELPTFGLLRGAVDEVVDLSDWGAEYAPPLQDAAARCASAVTRSVHRVHH